MMAPMIADDVYEIIMKVCDAWAKDPTIYLEHKTCIIFLAISIVCVLLFRLSAIGYH